MLLSHWIFIQRNDPVLNPSLAKAKLAKVIWRNNFPIILHNVHARHRCLRNESRKNRFPIGGARPPEGGSRYVLQIPIHGGYDYCLSRS